MFWLSQKSKASKIKLKHQLLCRGWLGMDRELFQRHPKWYTRVLWTRRIPLLI